MDSIQVALEGSLTIAPGTTGKSIYLLPCEIECFDGKLVSCMVLGDRHIFASKRDSQEPILTMCCRAIADREAFPNWPNPEPETV